MYIWAFNEFWGSTMKTTHANGGHIFIRIYIQLRLSLGEAHEAGYRLLVIKINKALAV